MRLVLMLTWPFSATRVPVTLAALLTVMEAVARMLAWMTAAVPRVAELPT